MNENETLFHVVERLWIHSSKNDIAVIVTMQNPLIFLQSFHKKLSADPDSLDTFLQSNSLSVNRVLT